MIGVAFLACLIVIFRDVGDGSIFAAMAALALAAIGVPALLRWIFT